MQEFQQSSRIRHQFFQRLPSNAGNQRTIARKTKNWVAGRRLLALASIYDGAPRTEAARIGG